MFMFILLSINGYYDDSFKNDFKVIVDFEGQIFWDFGGPFKTRCKIDMELYPYDSQKCSIVLGMWHYSSSFLRIHAEKPFPDVDVKHFETNLWELIAVDYTDEVQGNIDKATATYTFTFKRKPLYFMVNIVLPLVILLVISFGVFWLPAESGEKVKSTSRADPQKVFPVIIQPF